MTEVDERYARYEKLPKDEHYGNWTWEYVLENKYGVYTGAAEFDPEEIDYVVNWHTESQEGYGSHNACGVFKMLDGTFVVYTAWTDTTGWGCQDDARFTYHSSLADAYRMGLGDAERVWFGINLTD